MNQINMFEISVSQGDTAENKFLVIYSSFGSFKFPYLKITVLSPWEKIVLILKWPKETQ